VHRLKSVKLLQAGLEQRLRTDAISSAVVMERGGDLDHALEKGTLWLLRGQPDFFPRLVGFEELAAVELADSLLKTSILCVVAQGCSACLSGP